MRKKGGHEIKIPRTWPAMTTPSDDPRRAAEIVKPYAEAGVTWWLERIDPPSFGGTYQAEWPVDAMRRRIRQGPPARA